MSNIGTGPNTGGIGANTGQAAADAEALKNAFRDLLDSQGDFDDLLKSSIRSLKQMDSGYAKIEARLNSLNRDSINIKEVNQELLKIRQKEYLAEREVAIFREKSSNALAVAEYERIKNTAAINIATRKVDQDDLMERIKNEGNLEVAKLFALEKQLELSQAYTADGKTKLEIEKRIAKNLGISGNLAMKLANGLGVGKEAFSAMALEASKYVDENGKNTAGFFGKIGQKAKVAWTGIRAGGSAIKEGLSDPMVLAGGAVTALVNLYKLAEKALNFVGDMAKKAGTAIAGMSADAGNTVRGLTSGVTDLARNIPLVGKAVAGIVDGFAAIFDLVLGVDDKIVKMGRNLNMSADEARSINREFQQVAYNSNNVFITSKKLGESFSELATSMGTVNRLSNEALQTNIMLKDFAGLELETREKLVAVAQVQKTTVQDVTKGILAQVKGLKMATGIEFQNQKILKEVANLSGYLGLQFTKYPKELTKSLLTIKAMGMELKDVDALADSFLDFESSISKEFEAQLLTGKEINLAKARELFLNNDIAGAALEINRQVGTSKEFLSQNRIAAEAQAQAFGMSRDQLGEMLMKQERLSLLGAKDTDNAQKQLQLGLAKYKGKKELIAAMGEENYLELINASTQEKLMSFIEKIKQSVVDFIEKSNIIEKIENFVKLLSNPKVMRGIVEYIRGLISDFVKVTGDILSKILWVAGKIGNLITWGKAGDEFEAGTTKLAASIKNFTNNFGDGIKGGADKQTMSFGELKTIMSDGFKSGMIAAEQVSVSSAAQKKASAEGNNNGQNSQTEQNNGKPMAVNIQMANNVNTVTGQVITSLISISPGVKFDYSPLYK